MRLSPEVLKLISDALDAGRLQRIAEGVRGLPERLAPAPEPMRVLAESCRGGRAVERLPHLDEIDEETA